MSEHLQDKCEAPNSQSEPKRSVLAELTNLCTFPLNQKRKPTEQPTNNSPNSPLTKVQKTDKVSTGSKLASTSPAFSSPAPLARQRKKHVVELNMEINPVVLVQLGKIEEKLDEEHSSCICEIVTNEDEVASTNLQTLKWMKNREVPYNPNDKLFTWQSYITPKMRAILLDWVFEIAEEYELNRVTAQRCVNFIDRFLSKKPNLPSSRYQLVGITALFVATKLEEYKPFTLRELVTLTDNSYEEEHIELMESIMVQTLEWNLLPPVSSGWLEMFIMNMSLYQRKHSTSPINFSFPKVEFLRMSQVVDYFIMDHQSLRFPSSVISASVFFVYYCNDASLLYNFTGYTPSDLADCLFEMNQLDGIPPIVSCVTPVELLPFDFHQKQYRNANALKFVKMKMKRDAAKKLSPIAK